MTVVVFHRCLAVRPLTLVWCIAVQRVFAQCCFVVQNNI